MFLFVLGIIGFLVAIVAFIMGASMKEGGPVAVGVAALLISIVLIVVSCVSSVPTGHTGILSTFGAVSENVLPNGVNFHAPWQSVVTMSNKEQTFTEKNVAFSKDLQEVTYTYTVKYSLNATAAPTIYKTVGSDYFKILIKPQVNNAVKAQFGKCEAEDMTETRNEIQQGINDTVIAYADQYGITLQVFLDDFDFTNAYTNAIEAKQVAEQEALKDKTQQQMETERARQAAERAKIQAENEAAIRKINAEAEAEAAKVRAQADHEVARLEADAIAYTGLKEAEATKALADAITDEVVAYEYACNWSGHYPSYMMGDTSALPIFNLGSLELDE
jgi:regulator of protease activity HflC (stomatin/prohibitin superfamily)